MTEIHNNGGALTAQTSTSISSAIVNFANSATNTTGIPAALAPSVSVAASKTSAINNGSDAITITVTVKLGGTALPGAEVRFAIKSGAGTLSQKSVLTDAGGNASSALTSTLDGDTDIVTATAGGIATDSPSLGFANPNKPGSITLSANPGSGTTQAGGGVKLTATVSPVSTAGAIPDQTPVTFTIVTGTGTLSAITSTSSGIATASLSAASAGTLTITASAGTATSAPLSVSFVNQPTLAVVKIGTTGPLPPGTTIGGLQAVFSYTPGPYTLGNADVIPSGAALATPVGSLLFTPNASSGSLNLGLLDVTSQGVGMGSGEFATLNIHIAAGTFTAPTVTVAPGALIFDTNHVALTGMSITVLSTTLQ